MNLKTAVAIIGILAAIGIIAAVGSIIKPAFADKKDCNVGQTINSLFPKSRERGEFAKEHAPLNDLGICR
jgi:hypothetical protein